MIKRFLLVALLAVSVSVVVAPGSAQATGNCPGTAYPQQNYSYGGAVVATLCFANGGTGAATLQSVGKYRGVAKTMSLEVCKWNNTPYSCVTDSGTYSLYAGPITQPGGCEYFKSVMYDGNGNKIVNKTWVLCD